MWLGSNKRQDTCEPRRELRRKTSPAGTPEIQDVQPPNCEKYISIVLWLPYKTDAVVTMEVSILLIIGVHGIAWIIRPQPILEMLSVLSCPNPQLAGPRGWLVTLMDRYHTRHSVLVLVGGRSCIPSWQLLKLLWHSQSLNLISSRSMMKLLRHFPAHKTVTIWPFLFSIGWP